MTGVWMSFLPKVEMKTNKDPSCVPPELLREAFVLMAWSRAIKTDIKRRRKNV